MLAARLREDPQRFAGPWNFGPSSTQSRTVGEVASFIVNYLGRDNVVLGDAPKQQHEAQLLQLNCDKAHQLLGWYPRWNVDSTLKATADWYRTVMAGEGAKHVTARQIREYFHEIT
jgi:CDP-glucose 4,6-dehydratase